MLDTLVLAQHVTTHALLSQLIAEQEEEKIVPLLARRAWARMADRY